MSDSLIFKPTETVFQIPMITNMPQFTTLFEETTKQVLLASITITDGDDLSLTPTFNVDPPDPGFISIRSEGTDSRFSGHTNHTK